MNERMMEDLLRRITRLERGYADLKRPEVGRWVDWTPTVTQGVSVTFTKTYARYYVSGNTVIVIASLAITSAGTGGSAVVVGGIPSAIAPTNLGGSFDLGGIFLINDSGTGQYIGATILNTASTLVFRVDGNNANVGAAPNFALASGDEINFNLAYER